jgi:hypothetical protein
MENEKPNEDLKTWPWNCFFAFKNMSTRKIMNPVSAAYSCVGWRGVFRGARDWGWVKVTAQGRSVGLP